MIAVSANRSKNPLRNEIRKRLRQKMKKRRDTAFVKAMADRKWAERNLNKPADAGSDSSQAKSKIPKQISDPRASKQVINESHQSVLEWLAYEPKADVKFPPTAAEPGSAEKIDVLAERYEQGLPLWHKLDFRYCGTDSQVDW